MKELTNLNSSNNKRLLVVLPVKKLNDLYLNECAYSLAQQTYPIDLLVLARGLDENAKDKLSQILSSPKLTLHMKNPDGKSQQREVIAERKINFVIENTEKNLFPEVFNESFNYADKNGYEWFSVVEAEDVLDIEWYSYFNRFMDKKRECHGFLPLTREVSNGVFLGFLNEACWSEGLGVEVAGIFDLQLLMRFNCMNVTGTVFKTQALKEYSEESDGIFKPMKESIKVGYMYEFFLRMVYNDLKFFTIPRIGYEHRTDTSAVEFEAFSSKMPKNVVNRPKEQGGMSPEEYKWWSELPKREYFFNKDRKIEYVPQTV